MVKVREFSLGEYLACAAIYLSIPFFIGWFEGKNIYHDIINSRIARIESRTDISREEMYALKHQAERGYANRDNRDLAGLAGGLGVCALLVGGVTLLNKLSPPSPASSNNNSSGNDDDGSQDDGKRWQAWCPQG